ncbi:hypothetical protein [uncultured Croceitalea sp.]
MEFSEIGIERINKLAEKLLIGRKTKTYRESESFIEMQVDKLKIK